MYQLYQPNYGDAAVPVPEFLVDVSLAGWGWK